MPIEEGVRGSIDSNCAFCKQVLEALKSFRKQGKFGVAMEFGVLAALSHLSHCLVSAEAVYAVLE